MGEADGSMLRIRPEAAVLPLLVVAGVLTWWGWESGAYFGVVFFPGALVLFGMLAALLLFAPWPATLRGAHAVALVALLGIAALTRSPRAWSPAPGVAIEDALRVLTYAVAFALGLWICLLAGRADEAGAGPDRGRRARWSRSPP